MALRRGAPTRRGARLFGWTWGVRLRRMLGLFAFVYALLHAGTYVFIDQRLDRGALATDITKRRFIQIGGVTLTILAPLALTSTAAAVRRLGYVRWKQLHRLAYVAAVLGVVHFFFRVKSDLREPLVYGAVLAVLLVLRVVPWRASVAQAPVPYRASNGPPAGASAPRWSVLARMILVIAMGVGLSALAVSAAAERQASARVQASAAGSSSVCAAAPGAAPVPRALLVVHGRGAHCGW